MKKYSIPLVTMSALVACTVTFSAEKNAPKEVVMYEVMSKAFSTSKHTIPIGSSLKEVTISLSRDPVTGNLTNVQIGYGDKSTLVIPNSLVECVPHPLIEMPMFLFTSPGDRSQLPDDWHNSVVIPFGYSTDKAKLLSNNTPGAFLVNTYPAIVIEVSGFETIGRVKIRRDEGEFKISSSEDMTCPRQLVEWALK